MPRPKVSQRTKIGAGMGQFGTDAFLDGLGRLETVWDSLARFGMVWDRYFLDGLGQFGTVWDSLGRFGTV